MTDTTPRLALAELAAAQAQKHVTVNADLIALDAFIGCYILGNGTNTPPGSPADGDTYIVGGSPTGLWTGNAAKLAYALDGAWQFFAPFNGLRAFLATTKTMMVYSAGAWTQWNAQDSATDNITARAGGGQASATQLATTINRVATVATAADSVKLPTSAPGLTVFVVNGAASNALQLFGTSPDTINGVATGTGVSLAAGKTGIYTCPVAGKWFGGTLT